jgi:hypothetical protein
MSLEKDIPRETENNNDVPLPNDQLIDALLEEIIGGQSPPDLTSKILSQLRDSLPTTPQTPVNDFDTLPTPKSTTLARRRARSHSLAVPVSMTLSVTAITLALVAIVLNSSSSSTKNQGIANSQTQTSEKPTTLRVQQSNGNSADPETPEQETPNNLQITTLVDSNSTKPIGPSDVNAQVDEIDSLPPIRQRWQHPLALANTNTVAPVETEIILGRIRRELEKQWNEHGISPSEVAVDLEWTRRVYLRLIGRVPTTDELERFSRSTKQPNQANPVNQAVARQQLVDNLLYGDIYRAEFTQHWSTFWTNTLIGRQGGLDGDNANRGGLQQYLRESFAANKPYDEIVFELISAQGAANAESEQFNGAVNFLLASLTKNDTTLATSRISSIFLGQKLQCAQCHHHPTSDIAQDHFWELDAFLSGIQSTKINGQTILMNVDAGGVKTADGQIGVFFERPNGVAQMVFPSFLGHPPSELNTTAESPTGTQTILREQLAQFTSESPLLARTLVNRLWSHFLGFGFTPSVDDMGPHLAVSHPQLLSILSEQTESSNYDLKSLMKWIVLSDPFTRSSKYSASNDIDSPELGDQPLFSRYYSRQLEPEEVYRSLLVLSGEKRSAATIGQQQLAQRTWLGQFTKRMETDEGDETNSFDGNVHQSLVLMNGDLMKQATSITSTSVLGKIIKSHMPINNKIDHLFLAAVARYPSANEKKLILALFAKPDISPEQIFQDIWWALLNSNEFILDH